MSYASDPAAYEELMSEIDMGARLHYDTDGSVDPDLDLLEGDRAYANGLRKLAELGDLSATRTLGDAISAIAQLRASGDLSAAAESWNAALKTVREQR